MASSLPISTLLDVIVLCFAKSELGAIGASTAFKMALGGRQHVIFPEPDVVALQPVLEVAETQPGYNAKKAIAPLCRIKSWEGKLGVEIHMPAKLAIFDERARNKFSQSCNAVDSDLEKLLQPATPQTPVPLKRSERPLASSGETRPLTSSGSMRPLAPLPVTTLGGRKVKLALVAAIVGLGAAGVSLYYTLGRDGGAAVSLSVSELSDQIPFADLRINGTVMLATLTDASWIDKPEAERRRQLEAVAPKLQSHKATKLVIIDGKGSQIATVLAGPKVVVTLAR